ncbi:MATE family efflux transporter [Haloferula helveola]|uniref:Multidrug-efflux transporter n=1 Tax=Haloferula helveola TaxID=490095 RepID=A0ABM7RE63_9BACT|nr:MATE family efflux transporter [Haloferula helveola]
MPKPGRSAEASQRAVPEARLLGGRLAGLSLPRQVAVLAVWPLLEQVLTFAVGMTDLTISGRMAEGHERVAILDAMALGGYVAWFFNILQIAVATGVMALVSRSFGARDYRLGREALGQGVWLGLAAGLVSLAVLQLGIPPLIHWMDLKPVAARLAEDYLRVFAFSGIFSGPLLAINAALRGSGDTRTPFIGMVTVNGVNMICSWLFVFGPEPLGGRGIEGIALGTVVGWGAGLLVVSLLVRGGEEELHWSVKALRLSLDTLKRIMRVGAPQALEIAGMWGIHAYGIRIISRLPAEGALGAHILAIRVESMSFLPGFAIATAAAALAGQYLGAGSKEMAVKAVRLCWKFAALVMSAMGVFFILGGRQVVELVAPDSALHVTLAAPLFVVCALSQPFFASCIVLKTSMRGAGATPMVIRYSFVSMIFFRIIVLGSASHFGMTSLIAVWIILSLDLVCQSFIFARLHFRGKWLDAKV